MNSNRFNYLLFVVVLSLLQTSCILLKETSTEAVYRSSKSHKNYLIINKFSHSHCGCTDMFAKKYEHGELVYELYYGCTPFFSPEKIVYTYDKNDKLIATTNYKLVESANFDQSFDSLDLLVLQKMDSFRLAYKPALADYRLCKKSYTGLIKKE